MKTKKKLRKQKQTQKRGQRYRKSKRFQMSRRRKSIKGGAAFGGPPVPDDLDTFILAKVNQLRTSGDPATVDALQRLKLTTDDSVLQLIKTSGKLGHLITSMKFITQRAIPLETDFVNSYDVGGNADEDVSKKDQDTNDILSLTENSPLTRSITNRIITNPDRAIEVSKRKANDLVPMLANGNIYVLLESLVNVENNILEPKLEPKKYKLLSGGASQDTQHEDLIPGEPLAYDFTLAKKNAAEIYQSTTLESRRRLQVNLSENSQARSRSASAAEASVAEDIELKRTASSTALDKVRELQRSFNERGGIDRKQLATAIDEANQAEKEVELAETRAETYTDEYKSIELTRQLSLQAQQAPTKEDAQALLARIEPLRTVIEEAQELEGTLVDEQKKLAPELATAFTPEEFVGLILPGPEERVLAGHAEAPGRSDAKTPICCEKPLIERLQDIDKQLSHVHNDYLSLLQSTSSQTLIEFVLNSSPYRLPGALDLWRRNIHELLYGYQRISKEDLKKAFFRLLSTFDPTNPFLVDLTEVSPYHILIKTYAYKMVTSLFTSANITAAVFMYRKNITGFGPDTWQPIPPIPVFPNPDDRQEPPVTPPGLPVPDKYEYLRNLLSIMRCGSEIINTYLKEGWVAYQLPDGGHNVQYYHSGGNMIVMIAGMLCYLYDKNHEGAAYDVDILGIIRKKFELTMGPVRLSTFYTWLDMCMRDPIFRQSLYDCTLNISDLDFILMAPRDYVTNLNNTNLSKLHGLSAWVIRMIMITAYSDTEDRVRIAVQAANPALGAVQLLPAVATKMLTNAHALLPFHQQFREPWKNFGFYKMPPGAMVPALPLADGATYKGYRQTSNRIDTVPMYLNRLKQGYLPFFNIKGISNINPLIAETYSNKYGECIDLSIGTLENELYRHKHDNYEGRVYYTIDTILWELEQILLKPPDDKTAKRTMRRNFLTLIDTPEVNILFQTIGSVIQYII